MISVMVGAVPAVERWSVTLMSLHDVDNLVTWRRRPVSVLLFVAVWSGFLACWALGLIPTGEWPPPPGGQPKRFADAEWWSRFRWAMVAPTVLVGISVVLASRRSLRRRKE